MTFALDHLVIVFFFCHVWSGFITCSFEKGDLVKVMDGPFSNFSGSVEDINPERERVKVMVTIFGRQTPVELEYHQIEKE